jgi:hypothetical protein
LYVPDAVCDDHGLAEGDAAWLTVAQGPGAQAPGAGRWPVRVRRMAALHGQTVWMWAETGPEPDGGPGPAPFGRAGDATAPADGSPPGAQGDPVGGPVSDPVTGAPAQGLRVRIARARPDRPA